MNEEKTLSLAEVLGLPDLPVEETPPAPPTEKPSPKPAMEESQIVNYVMSCYTKSAEDRMIKEEQWLSALEQYNLLHDYSHKAHWQAKIILPKVFDVVEHIVTFIEEGLLASPEFYKIESISTKEAIPELIKELLDFHFDNKFFIELSQAIRYALLTGIGILKVRHTFNPKKPFVIECVSTFDTYLDPTRLKKFIIHRVIKSWDELYEAQEKGANYVNLDKVKERSYAEYEIIKEKIAKGELQETALPNLKEVTLYEFWGNIYNEDGTVAYKNIVTTVANKHTLIRSPQSFEDYFDDIPFIVFSIIPGMQTNYPPSFIGNLWCLAKYINEVASIMFDVAAYTVPIFRINPSAIFNAEVLLEGIMPGLTIEGMENAIEVIRAPAGITQDLIAIFNLFKSEFQEASGVTEYIAGRPPTKGRPTAKEVLAKRAQGAMFFNKFARAVEFQMLDPLIRLLYSAIRKFILTNDRTFYDEIGKKYGVLFSALPQEERIKYLPEDVEFKVYGLSLLTSQSEKLEKLISFMNVVSKIAPLQEVLDMAKVVKKFAELLGIYPLDIFKEEIIKSFIEREKKEKEEEEYETGEIIGI